MCDAKRSFHFMDLPFQFKYFTAVTGMDGMIESISPGLQEVTGYSMEEWIGKKFPSFIHSDDIDQFKGLFRKKAEDMGMFLYRLQTKSGNYKWVESTYSIYNDTELNGRGHIRILTKDMTVVKDLYDYLIYSEKLSMIGQLAAGIAHEIRNPLTSIKGFLQLMQAGVIDTKNYLDIMENEIDRIETISSELLFLGRPKESQLKICSIQKLLDEVLILMESQSFKQNVRIETNFLCKPFYIRCDESKLKQVFINLVKNGLEAMEQGGTLKIEIYEAAFHQVAVAIKDEGCGIPQENLEQIGQPFYTTKEGGNGLGLMVCFQIIHEHHGKISIASEPQKGSTFTVVLPTVQPEENGQT